MRRQIFWASLILALLCGPVMGDDIHPPPWRGQYSTTSQVWEFSTSLQLNIPPDCAATGGQPPLASTMITRIVPGPMPWDHWLDIYNSRQGIWPLSGLMDVIVDNHKPPNWIKEVWVQITWMPQTPGELPIFENLDPAPVKPPMLLDCVSLPNGWFHSTYYWEIRPNPPDEVFTITGTINVDELVIDTWCIPEPATMALAALGGCGLIFLRKRFGK